MDNGMMAQHFTMRGDNLSVASCPEALVTVIHIG
jgi:hypothetical protein